MKKIFVTFIYLISICQLPLLTQTPIPPCNSDINCDSEKEYPYRVCDPTTGEKLWTCLKDPRNFSMPPLVLMKQTIPICLVFNSQTSDQVRNKQLDLKNSNLLNTRQVFKPDYTQNDADNATRLWNCLCGVDNTQCACTVYYDYSSNINFFEKDVNDKSPGNNYWSIEQLSKDKCPNICNNTIIHLNCSSKFENTPCYSIPQNPKKYYINNKFFEDNPNYLDRPPDTYYNAINLLDVFLNATGWILGLEFFNVWQFQPGIPGGGWVKTPTCPQYLSTGRMDVHDNARIDQASDGLSNDDKCAFIKLYCWDERVPVIEDNSSKHSSLSFPNPCNTCNISFTVPIGQEYVNITLFNNLGQKIEVVADGIYVQGEHKITLNSEKYIEGVYYCIINIGKNTETQKVVVMK